MQKVKSLHADGYDIAVEYRKDSVILHWTGEVTVRDPNATLGPYLDDVLKSADKRTVVLDFSELGFMNSSTLLPITAFMKAAETQKVKSELWYKGTVSWQFVSRGCMQVLCQKFQCVSVKTV
jgi:hypothetical protein